MLAIGVYAWRKSTDDVGGYLLGGRRLTPSVAALSAGASDMSGWLLLGLPGAAYLSGVSAAWIAIGLFAGALANYLIVAPRLRVHTEQTGDSITIPEFFERRLDDNSHALRIVSALVIILFFTLYTSSGMVAGGKLFETAFGADYALGLWVTAGVVILYTLIGGFLAVSLTDFVQGIIMFLALIIVPLVAFSAMDSSVAAEVARVNPDALDLFAGTTALGIISSLAWGLGYFGQPHIITRFMAVRSVRDVPAMRNIGMSWMGVSLIGALATGFIGLAYTTRNGIAVTDPETIFILLSQILFHPLITGFPLRGLAGGDHEHDQLAASGVVQLADRGFLSRVPAPRRQPARAGDGRARERAGGGAGRDRSGLIRRTIRSWGWWPTPGRGSAPPSGRW
jgi:SSS family solute:Na+ symporter/sodium/proline symporter